MDNANAIQATGSFVTNKGFNLITKLAAAQATLEFTRAAVGTGKPPEGYSPESMIGLNAYKMDAEISDYGVQDDTAYVTTQISSDNVQEGFLATEVGIFAEDPDEGEILYGYMDISTDPTYIYANGSSNRSKFAEFTLYMLIGSVSSVVAAVTPGSIITKETFRAENMQATDTYGFLGGDEGASSTGQAMMDAIINRIMTQLVTNSSLMEQLGAYVLKSKIVNNFLATDAETVLSGPMGKNLKEQLDVLNTKLTGLFVTANLSVGYTLDSWGVADVTLPFSPPGGYSFFCVNRIDTADIRPVALTSYYQSGNNLIVGLCNCSAQSISGTLVATNVYLKSDFWGSL